MTAEEIRKMQSQLPAGDTPSLAQAWAQLEIATQLAEAKRVDEHHAWLRQRLRQR
jgi:hypothetical protein